MIKTDQQLFTPTAVSKTKPHFQGSSMRGCILGAKNDAEHMADRSCDCASTAIGGSNKEERKAEQKALLPSAITAEDNKGGPLDLS